MILGIGFGTVKESLRSLFYYSILVGVFFFVSSNWLTSVVGMSSTLRDLRRLRVDVVAAPLSSLSTLISAASLVDLSVTLSVWSFWGGYLGLLIGVMEMEDDWLELERESLLSSAILIIFGSDFWAYGCGFWGELFATSTSMSPISSWSSSSYWAAGMSDWKPPFGAI